MDVDRSSDLTLPPPRAKKFMNFAKMSARPPPIDDLQSNGDFTPPSLLALLRCSCFYVVEILAKDVGVGGSGGHSLGTVTTLFARARSSMNAIG